MKLKLLLSYLFAAFFVVGCSDYDDSIVKDELADLTDRVESLEDWQDEVNSWLGEIASLIEAYDALDCVTSVTEVDGGYKLTFKESSSITIQTVVASSILGVEAYEDPDYGTFSYCWQVSGEWLLNADGEMVSSSEVLSVKTFSNATYLCDANGDWYYDANGNMIEITASENLSSTVVLSEDEGTVTITIDGFDDPFVFEYYRGITVNFGLTGDENSGVVVIGGVNKVNLYLTNVTSSNYKTMKAEILDVNGNSDVTLARSEEEVVAGEWTLELGHPTFDSETGALSAQPTLYVTPTVGSELEAANVEAYLKITLLDDEGVEYTRAAIMSYVSPYTITSFSDEFTSTVTEAFKSYDGSPGLRTVAIIVDEENPSGTGSLSVSDIAVGDNLIVTFNNAVAVGESIEISGTSYTGNVTLKTLAESNEGAFDISIPSGTLTVSAADDGAEFDPSYSSITANVLSTSAVTVGEDVTVDNLTITSGSVNFYGISSVLLTNGGDVNVYGTATTVVAENESSDALTIIVKDGGSVDQVNSTGGSMILASSVPTLYFDNPDSDAVVTVSGTITDIASSGNNEAWMLLNGSVTNAMTMSDVCISSESAGTVNGLYRVNVIAERGDSSSCTSIISTAITNATAAATAADVYFDLQIEVVDDYADGDIWTVPTTREDDKVTLNFTGTLTSAIIIKNTSTTASMFGWLYINATPPESATNVGGMFTLNLTYTNVSFTGEIDDINAKGTDFHFYCEDGAWIYDELMVNETCTINGGTIGYCDFNHEDLYIYGGDIGYISVTDYTATETATIDLTGATNETLKLPYITVTSANAAPVVIKGNFGTLTDSDEDGDVFDEENPDGFLNTYIYFNSNNTNISEITITPTLSSTFTMVAGDYYYSGQTPEEVEEDPDADTDADAGDVTE